MYMLDTPKELIEKLVLLIEKERKTQKIKQVDLASKADIPLPTYREFVYRHKISLENLLKLFFALRMHDNITGMLTKPSRQTLADLKEDTLPKRVRK